MTVIDEIESLMDLDPSTELKRYADEEGLNDRIREWLYTPMGTVADLPAWGHNLWTFKFEPGGEDLSIMAQMSITQKMPQDIENLIIRGVLVEEMEIDLFKITILHQLGGLTEAFRL